MEVAVVLLLRGLQGSVAFLHTTSVRFFVLSLLPFPPKHEASNVLCLCSSNKVIHFGGVGLALLLSEAGPWPAGRACVPCFAPVPNKSFSTCLSSTTR